MRLLAGYVMIGVGSFIFLISIIIGTGDSMASMFQMMLQLGVKAAPLNEPHEIWMVFPMSVYLIASVRNIMIHMEEGFLGVGEVEFQVTLSTDMSLYETPKDVVAAIFIQEDAEFDEVNRFVVKGGPLNYPNIFCWIMAMSSLGALAAAIHFRVKTYKRQSNPNKVNMSASSPHLANLQIIQMETKG